MFTGSIFDIQFLCNFSQYNTFSCVVASKILNAEIVKGNKVNTDKTNILAILYTI